VYKLFVLTGASGIGKSTLMFKLSKTGMCEIAPKYSERLKRKGLDDIIYVDSVYDKELSCDIVYELYGTKYGVNTKEIKEKLQNNNQVIIISDIESIKKLRNIFRKRIITIYISISNIHMKSFIESYIQREELLISLKEKREFIGLVYKGLESIKFHQDIGFYNFDKGIYAKMNQYFSNNTEFKKFIKRLESRAKAHEIYNRNKSLFNYSFEASEKFLKKFCKIVDTNDNN